VGQPLVNGQYVRLSVRDTGVGRAVTILLSAVGLPAGLPVVDDALCRAA
jgi:hypothetical protein